MDRRKIGIEVCGCEECSVFNIYACSVCRHTYTIILQYQQNILHKLHNKMLLPINVFVIHTLHNGVVQFIMLQNIKHYVTQINRVVMQFNNIIGL